MHQMANVSRVYRTGGSVLFGRGLHGSDVHGVHGSIHVPLRLHVNAVARFQLRSLHLLVAIEDARLLGDVEVHSVAVGLIYQDLLPSDTGHSAFKCREWFLPDARSWSAS